MTDQLELSHRIDRLAREARWRVDVITSPQRFVDWEPTALARVTGYIVTLDAEGRASSAPASSPAIIEAAQEAWTKRRPDLAANRNS